MGKTCSRCRQEKDATHIFFAKHPKTRDGLQSWCRKCATASTAEYKRRKRAEIRTRDIECNVCGAIFVWVIEKGRPANTCSEECRRKRVALVNRLSGQNEKNAARTRAARRKVPRTCRYCGESYFRPGGTRFFCSEVCSRKQSVENWKKGSRKKTLAQYGLDEDSFNAMVNAGAGNCHCCARPLEESIKTCVDHCHDTGVVRGILCHQCNSGIGLLGDTLLGVLRAANYLRRVETSLQ